MLTNFGLVEFVKKARDMKAGYVYGTTGQTLNEQILADKLERWPNQVRKYLPFIRDHWMGKVTYDCVNLIKAYIWQNDDKPGIYDPDNDVSANGMYAAARVKGLIDTMPEIIGLGVRYEGHIGVYIGGGKVIEARGTTSGVVETELKGRGWSHWLELPYITYLTDEKEGLRRGDMGDDVELLQRLLNAGASATLVVDGSFGAKTENALKRFQEAHNLKSDGIADQDTLRAVQKAALDFFATLLTENTKNIAKISNIEQAYKGLGRALGYNC